MTPPPSRKETGAAGEGIAAQFLERKGFKIVARNYRKPWGEIDIIAEKSGCVRFVEVKAIRASGKSSLLSFQGYLPEEQVHEKKLAKLARTAELYMAKKKDAREFQIDVVGVIMDDEKRIAHCRLFEQVL